MNPISRFIKKISLTFKKHYMYEKEPESVDIRSKSIPDWLYKITIKDTSNLKKTGNLFYTANNKSRSNLKLIVNSLKSKDVLDKSLSRYKLETIQRNKNQIITKVESYLKITDKKPESIEDFKDYYKIISQESRNLNSSIKKYKESVEKYFSSEIKAIGHEISLIDEELLKFSSNYRKTNDEKIEKIKQEINEIHNTYDEIQKHESELKKVEKEIEKVRENIYKLSEKINLIKKSPRFSDILNKEGSLAQLLKDKESIFSEMQKKLAKIEFVLFKYSEKIREQELVKEYVNHLPQAIEHDKQKLFIKIVEETKKELQNKKTKIYKDLGQEKAQEYVNKIELFEKYFKESIENIIEIEKKIKNIKSRLRNYTILNELEDKEERKKFYQQNLNELSHQRQILLKKINSSDLEEKKEKLRKDLLIISGYDVNIIYEFQETSSKEILQEEE